MYYIHRKLHGLVASHICLTYNEQQNNLIMAVCGHYKIGKSGLVDGEAFT